MQFILYHVLQSLVVDWAGEDVCRQRLPRRATRQIIFAIVGEAVIDERLTHLSQLAARESSSVLERPAQHAGFAGNELEHLPQQSCGWGSRADS